MSTTDNRIVFDKKTIPLLLRGKRDLKGMTVEQVAAALDEKGLHIAPKTLYNYEKGVSMPSVPIFIALCDIYGVSDILSAVAPHKSSAIRFADEDWRLDQYNDFFNNRGIFGKIYLLLRDGIPSFSGYEDALNDCLPSDSDAANRDKFWNLFDQLNEYGQDRLFCELAELLRNPDCLKNPSASGDKAM